MSEVRIELGFVGGGGVTSTVETEQWEQLEAALSRGDSGWVTLPERDGDQIVVAVDKVIFARIRQISHTVGFAGAG